MQQVRRSIEGRTSSSRAGESREVLQVRTSINNQYNIKTYITEEKHLLDKLQLVFNTVKRETEDNRKALQFSVEHCAYLSFLSGKHTVF
jgi:hypothetical protein